MRLTPSWFRSSGQGADERGENGEPDPLSEITIDYEPSISSSRGDGITVGEFIPDSDSELAETIAQLETPVTVDEITDQLVRPRRPPLETWAEVHERLHQQRLPALDAADLVEFDATQGVVTAPSKRSATNPASGGWLTRATFVGVSLALSIALFAELVPPITTAVIVTAAVAAFIVP